MAPFHFTGVANTLVTLLIGFGFGFVLERAGFGNCRNLAAQFYLYDMRVLKVMFTAIVTAMVLLFTCSALGWVDFSQIWVPPTHLGPAIIGGLLLGFGFIVGGYCPGTSVVSASTLKIDGAFFAGGVMTGMFVFGLAVPEFAQFWSYSGDLGRWTIFEWLRVDAGWVVAGVVVMALGAFAMAEWSERVFDPEKRTRETAAGTDRVVRMRYAAALCGVLLAVVGVVVGQPTTARAVARQAQQLDARLASREVFIDPAELLDLMYNNQVELVLLDVRPEADYNQFHLLDARRTTLAKLETGWAKDVSSEKVIVLMSNDEQAAVEAWKRVAVYPNANAYVLAGGINRWLALYQDHQTNVPGPEQAAIGNDAQRHHFAEALGDRRSAARPDKKKVPPREFRPHVKVRKPIRVEGGGCG